VAWIVALGGRWGGGEGERRTAGASGFLRNRVKKKKEDKKKRKERKKERKGKDKKKINGVL
jgi:hypothetical protein